MNKPFSIFCCMALLCLLSPRVDCLSCYVYASLSTFTISSASVASNTSDVDCKFCKKSVGTVLGITTSTGSCSTSCTAGSASILGVSSTVYCCTTDLCNSSISISSSKVFIILVVLATSFLRIFRD